MMKPAALLSSLVAACLSLCLLGQGAVSAQAAGGQFWVRAFEDRNGNSVFDTGEPLLTRGVGVMLQNSDGVVIATALLDESPNAAQGLIGFQFLTPGDYTLIVAAPDLSVSTETQFTRTISSGTIPTVVEFGGQRLDLLPQTSGTAAEERGLFGLPIFLGEPGQVARVALSLLGAMAAAFVMFLIGTAIYALSFGRQYRRLLAAVPADGLNSPATTGSMPRVTDTQSRL